MKLSTLLLNLGVGCGLVAASGFSLARSVFPQGAHGGYLITPSTETPKSRRRGLGPSIVGTTDSGEIISSNWAGIVVQEPPASEHFVSASVQIQVPGTKLPAGSPPGTYIYSVWVGIDGVDGAPGLFQGGLAFTMNVAGEVASDAWVEWIPDAAVGIDDTLPNGEKEFSFDVGDWIEVHIDTHPGSEHPSTGTITVTNLETNQEVKRDLHVPRPGFEVVGKSVEWIVERITVNGQLTTLPDFGEVYFDNCNAVTKRSDGSAGRSVDLSGAARLVVEQGGNLTSRVETIDEISFKLHFEPHKRG